MNSSDVTGLITAVLGLIIGILWIVYLISWMNTVVERLGQIADRLKHLAGAGPVAEPEHRAGPRFAFRKKTHALRSSAAAAMHCPACNNTLSAAILSVPAPACPHCHAELSVE